MQLIKHDVDITLLVVVPRRMESGGDETLGTQRPSNKYAIIMSKPSNCPSLRRNQCHIFPKEWGLLSWCQKQKYEDYDLIIIKNPFI